MPALSSPSTWRTHPYRYKKYLFVLAPSVVFAARVNQASFDYPLAEVTYDTVTTGAFGDIKAGMTVLIGSTAGGDDLGRQRIRTAADASKIYIGWSSRGTRDGEINPADNAYITVLNDFRIWAKTPRILDDGTMYKDYDLTLGTNGTQPPPVANGGVGYAGFVNTGTGLATVSFSATASIAVASGATITGYLWGVGDGTIVSGSSSTDEMTATFPAGFRYVSLRVTDSNGKTHTCYIPVFAANTTTYRPISKFEVNNHVIEPNGTTMNFTIYEDIVESSYPAGTLVMYWEEEKYGSTSGSLAGYTNREHMKFIGWHDTSSATVKASANGIRGGTEFACIGAAGRLARLPGYPQTVSYSASPANWAEMASLNIDRYLWYLLHWHSTVLDVSDFSWSFQGNSYPVTGLQSDGASLWDQVSERTKSIAYELTCDQRGRIVMRANPLLADTGFRTATVQVALAASDWQEITVNEERPPRTHWLTGAAIIAHATQIEAVQCIAPGEAPGQGVTADVFNYQLVTTQDELNIRTGHEYARRNPEFPVLDVALLNMGDAGIDPALFEWVTLAPSAAFFERGWSFTGVRFLPIRVSVSHNNNGTKRVVLSLFAETSGTPAVTVPVLVNTDAPPITPPPVYTPPNDDSDPYHLNYGTERLLGVNSDGYVYKTTDFLTSPQAGGPYWNRVDLGLDGDPVHGVVDAFSPLYMGTGEEVNAWIATTLKLYYVSDIGSASPTVTLQHTFRAPSDKRSLDSPFGLGAEGRVYCVSRYPDGVYETHALAAREVCGDSVSINFDDDTDQVFTYIHGEYSASGGNTGACAKGEEFYFSGWYQRCEVSIPIYSGTISSVSFDIKGPASRAGGYWAVTVKNAAGVSVYDSGDSTYAAGATWYTKTITGLSLVMQPGYTLHFYNHDVGGPFGQSVGQEYLIDNIVVQLSSDNCQHVPWTRDYTVAGGGGDANLSDWTLAISPYDGGYNGSYDVSNGWETENVGGANRQVVIQSPDLPGNVQLWGIEVEVTPDETAAGGGDYLWIVPDVGSWSPTAADTNVHYVFDTGAGGNRTRSYFFVPDQITNCGIYLNNDASGTAYIKRVKLYGDAIFSDEALVGSSGLGSLTETITVNANDSSGEDSVTSFTNGALYLVKVVGATSYNGVGGDEAAAGYYEYSGAWYKTSAGVNANLLGLRIDGADPGRPIVDVLDETNQTYWYFMVGDGTTVNFKFADINHADNVGSWTVQVYPYTGYGTCTEVWDFENTSHAPYITSGNSTTWLECFDRFLGDCDVHPTGLWFNGGSQPASIRRVFDSPVILTRIKVYWVTSGWFSGGNANSNVYWMDTPTHAFEPALDSANEAGSGLPYDPTTFTLEWTGFQRNAYGYQSNIYGASGVNSTGIYRIEADYIALGTAHPGVHGSTKADGRVYTSAVITGGGDGYKSTNHGETYSAITNPNINPDDDLAGDIHVPWQNNSTEQVVYHGRLTGDTRKLIRIGIDGLTQTDVSPETGYGPWKGKWQVAAWSEDRRYLVACCGDSNAIYAGVWVSTDYGGTWYEIVAPTADDTRYERAVIAGNTYQAIYFFGRGGAMGFSDDFGTVVDDQRGNIEDDFTSIGEFVMIAGY